MNYLPGQPVRFHNLSEFERHFVMEKMSTCLQCCTNFLSATKELYLLFSKNIEPCSIKFRFIFSFRFIAWYNQFQLLIKGNMRYDYLDCFEKFEVTKLPPLDNPCDCLKA